MRVSDKIRAIRVAKGLSQAEVARRYGTSPEFYHRLEKKENRSITWDQLIKVAEALEVPYEELIGSKASSNGNTQLEILQATISELEAKNKSLRHNFNLVTTILALINQWIEDGSIVIDSNKQASLDAFKRLMSEHDDSETGPLDNK